MKHTISKVLISLFVAAIALPLSSCDFLSEIISQMGGDDPTNQESEFFCDHEFDDGVSVDGQATCQKKGKIKYTCKLCGYTEERNNYMVHTPANLKVYEHDEEYHWHTCQWCNTVIDKEEHKMHETVLVQYTCLSDGESKFDCDCGYTYNATHAAEHYFRVKDRVEPTCEHEGLETYYPCPACGLEKEDEVLEPLPHKYIGETCEYCWRDMLLDYIDDFKAHGDNQDDPISIESEQELICLGNYTVVNTIYDKYFEFNYEMTGNVKQMTQAAVKKLTAANTSVSYSGATSGKISFIGCKKANTYSKKSGVDYEESYGSPLISPGALCYVERGSRSSSFDNFKINERHNELKVDSSDELFYAVSHGYKPTFEDGSDIEKLYKDMKGVLREIIDDDMSDVEKLYSIMCWSTEHAVYDNGAVSASDAGLYSWTDIRAWSVEGFFYDQKCICDAFSKAYAIFAGIEGIRCVQVSGSSHAWNKVYIDAEGKGEYEWFIIDPTFANATLNQYETSSSSDFLNTDQYKADEHYYYDNYCDCIATRELNPFRLLHYGNGKKSTSNDFFLQTNGEVSNYLTYIAPTVKKLHSEKKDQIIELCIPNDLKFDSNLLMTILGMNISSGYQFTESPFASYTLRSILYLA